MKKLIFGLILAIGAMIALTACSDSSNTPTGVTKAYYEALIKNDFKAAMEFCCKKDGKLLTDEEKQQLSGMMESKLNDEKTKAAMVAKYELGEETIAEDGNSATVKVKTTTVEGTEKEVESNCLKVDGKWYINSGK